MDSRLGGSYSATDSGTFTDLNRLAQMKGKDKDSPENVKKVAQEFESLFLNQMMKSMREANQALADEDSPFSSGSVKQYQDMYDQQMSVSLSRDNGGIGLADVLERQMSKSSSGIGRKNPFAQVGEVPTAPAAANTAKAESPAPVAEKMTVASRAPAAAVDSGRDDSFRINQRRLALPGNVAERIAARIVPEAGENVLESRTIAEQIRTQWSKQADSNPLTETVAGGYQMAAPQRIFLTDKSPAGAQADADIAATRSDQMATTASKTRFKSRDEFVQTMLPMAEAAAKRIGVDPRYLVAQAALETGWGKHMVKTSDGSSANNLFGIKSHGWGGKNAVANTQEYFNGQAVTEKASFRAYDSYAESFHDYVSFLQGNERYSKALSGKGGSEQFMRDLQKAGYATDPQYARKINQIARNMDTYQSIQMLAQAGTGTQRL
jgi:flagellar protein FlgJ